MADRRSRSQSDIHLLDYLPAFTMAEILISLTIIGVIAAITQAIAMMPSLNGYGIGATEQETAEHAAEAFITDGLSKVLKITNVCDSENLKKCGFPDKFTKMGTNSKMDTPQKLTDLNPHFNNSTKYVNYSQIDTNSAAFETANGESILTFYNPNCSYTYGVNGKDGKQNLMQPTMCANFIYDLNGRKGPNKVGKDIGFMTAFYPTDTQVIAPYPQGYSRVTDDGSHPQFSIGYGNLKCRKNFGDDAKMANIEELKSLFVNNRLGDIGSGNEGLFIVSDSYISSTVIDSYAYAIEGYIGKIYIGNLNYNGAGYRRTFCVKK